MADGSFLFCFVNVGIKQIKLGSTQNNMLVFPPNTSQPPYFTNQSDARSMNRELAGPDCVSGSAGLPDRRAVAGTRRWEWIRSASSGPRPPISTDTRYKRQRRRRRDRWASASVGGAVSSGETARHRLGLSRSACSCWQDGVRSDDRRTHSKLTR